MSLALGLAARPFQLGERLAIELREALLRHVRALALGGLLVAAAGLVTGLYLWAGQRFAPPPMSYVTSVVPIAVHIPMALAYALVGAILAARRPDNAIGWLFLSIGVLSSFVPAIDFLVAAASRQYVAPPATTVLLAWLASNFHLPMVSALVIVVFLIFPDGHAVSARWARAGWVAVAGALLVGFGQALDPAGLRWYPTLPNPTAAPVSFGPVALGIQVAGMGAIIGALGAAMWTMVMRWRCCSRESRRGLAPVVASVLGLAATGGSLVIVRYGLTVGQSTGEIVLVATLLAATMVPIAAAFAMLRYHLFDVDLVLAHALVYVPLTGFLAGLYAASVALFTRIFVALTGDSSDVVVVLATLLLAGTFAPLRKVLENFVDRHFKPAERKLDEASATRLEAANVGEAAQRVALSGPEVPPAEGQPSAQQATEVMTELHELQARLAHLEAELERSAA